jgi:5,10-methenyltetrahydrofolate synthetase
MDKKSLRAEMIARRDAIPPAELRRTTTAFTQHLLALPAYARAGSVLATMSIGSEWSTLALLKRALADGKSIVLPRITRERPKRLEIYRVADLRADLVPGVWDIPEPDPARCPKMELSSVDFAVVPALAVDVRGYRLCYGAGFFDGLLKGRGARPLCVTALSSDFIVERLPDEPHDVPVDLVIDETGAARVDRRLAA